MNMGIKIKILGQKCGLSKSLREHLKEKDLCTEVKNDYNKSQIILVATFSPTLRNDTQESSFREIEYYTNLIASMSPYDHLIYISSQTVENTDTTFFIAEPNTKYKII